MLELLVACFKEYTRRARLLITEPTSGLYALTFSNHAKPDIFADKQI